MREVVSCYEVRSGRRRRTVTGTICRKSESAKVKVGVPANESKCSNVLHNYPAVLLLFVRYIIVHKLNGYLSNLAQLVEQ